MQCFFAVAMFLVYAAPATEPAVKVEFRRAQWEPGEGLTAASVPGTDRTVYMADEAELTNADIASAKAALAEDGRHYVIDVTMTDKGAAKLKELSSKHLTKPLAVLIDGKLWIAPRILAPLSLKFIIAGNLERDEADRVATGIVGQAAP